MRLAPSTSRTMLVSVISSSSQEGSQPVRWSSFFRSGTRAASRSWLADRFTQIAMPPTALSAPRARPGGTRPRHPLAHGMAQARLFGQGDEARGHHEAPLGVLPAKQGLGARDRAGGHVHDRLEVQQQLALAQRAAQRLLDLHAMGPPLPELDGERAESRFRPSSFACTSRRRRS
jgi:hypothetical protein